MVSLLTDDAVCQASSDPFPAGEGKACHILSWCQVEVQVQPLISTDSWGQMVGTHDSLEQWRDESLTSLLGFGGYPGGDLQRPYHSLISIDVWDASSTLFAQVKVEQLFSLWFLSGVKKLLSKVFCLASLPLSQSFGQKQQVFCLFIHFVFVWAFWHFQIAVFFSCKYEIFSAKQNARNSQLRCFWSLQFPSWSSVHLPSLLICNAQYCSCTQQKE